ncbi:unnamed protein product [Schistosoma guineensis]|nr:unnamed protein product [Schistosoma guineensis]
MTSTTTTITSTPTNTDVHCSSGSNNNQIMIITHSNSLPQTIQHNSTGLHNDNNSNNNNMSILCNAEIIPVECDTCSNLFIGFSERTINLNNSFIATVNLILNNPQHNNNNNSSTHSILNIGILYLTKLYNWESINNHLVNLYNLYTSYLNLNDPHDLQMNEFKQYQLHIDSLNYTWYIEFHPNTSNYSIQFKNNNNERTIQNPQHLINLIQSQSKQFNIQLTINYDLLNIEQPNLLADHLNDDQQNLFKQLNNLMIKTLLNRDILYFYYELLYTYHLMIFYDIDDVYMNIVIQAFYEHICSSINSSSLKLHHFNLTDSEQTTMNDLYQCLSQYMNNTINITEQLPTNLIILFYIQSMNQMSNDDYLKIINDFQVYYNGNKDDPNRTCSIYLIGTWITSVGNSSIESSSSPLSSIPGPLQNLTTTSSSMNVKLISYPNKYNSIYKSVQCFNELICWIEIDYSFKQSYMIGDLKKQLVHSLVNEFNEKLSSSSLLNQMDQEYLDKFHNQLKYYEDLIKWIQQVLNYLNQFIIELHNHYHETTLEDTHQFHLINPLIFSSLPFHDDLSNSELWFIDLWNNQIVKMIKNFIDQWSNHHQKSIKQPVNCIDPTNWILSTWPWHTTNWLECFHKHKHNNTDMISPPCLIHLIE